MFIGFGNRNEKMVDKINSLFRHAFIYFGGNPDILFTFPIKK